MSNLSPALSLLVSCFSLPLAAQLALAPTSAGVAGSELPSASDAPFGVASCRLQQGYAASELSAAAFLASTVSLRFDGPSGGVARPHTIARLVLRVGTTAVGIHALGSQFDANLSQPLTVALDAPVNFRSDGQSVAGPEPFAAGVVLSLAQPVPLNVGSADTLLVELATFGCDIGADLARCDAVVDPANAVGNGSVTRNGNACPIGQGLPGAALELPGVYEPGGSFAIRGTGYLPGAPVVSVLTATLLPQPLALPNTTPNCWIYLEPGTLFGTLSFVADGGGGVDGGRGGTLPLPKRPRMSGATIYVQNFTLATPWSGNPAGIASSNYRTITVGQMKAPAVSGWVAEHGSDGGAPVANSAYYGGLALRID